MVSRIKFVICYQRVNDGSKEKSFVGKIEEETSSQFYLKKGRKKEIFKVSKAACSTKRFKTSLEASTANKKQIQKN